MGHLQGSKSSLVPLIDRLYLCPIGLADTARSLDKAARYAGIDEAVCLGCGALLRRH